LTSLYRPTETAEETKQAKIEDFAPVRNSNTYNLMRSEQFD